MLAALPTLRVEAPGELPCELGERLRPALVEQGLVVDGRAAHRLVVVRAGRDLVVRLLDGSGRELGWRTLKPTAGDCPVLPRTVGLLARAWLSARVPPASAADAGEAPTRAREELDRDAGAAPLSEAPRDAAVADAGGPAGALGSSSGSERDAGLAARAPRGTAPTSSPRQGDARSEPGDGGARPPRTAELRTEPDAGAPASSTGGEAGTPTPRAAGGAAEAPRTTATTGTRVRAEVPASATELPPDAGPPDAGPPDAGPPDAGPPDAGPPPPSMTLTIAAAGGVSLDSARPAGQVTAFAEWGFREPWGLVLDLGFETPRQVTLPPGTVTLQSYWLGLAARRTLVRHLNATLGVRLFLLPASTAGFTLPASRLLVSGAVYAAVDWRQPVYGPLFLLARLGGQARFQAEEVVVPGVQGSLFLPEWSFFAQAGLGLKL